MQEIHLCKVISGGQTGADIAGLKAARTFGIATGGVMPKGFKTTDGSKPEWAELYGLKEHPSANYRYRTIDNILTSTGTLVLSFDLDSPGTKLTIDQAKHFGKPLQVIHLVSEIDSLSIICDWLTKEKIQVLNVGGNSAKTFPDIEEMVYDILYGVFSELGFKDGNKG